MMGGSEDGPPLRRESAAVPAIAAAGETSKTSAQPSDLARPILYNRD
jgi:hypothetical protein